MFYWADGVKPIWWTPAATAGWGLDVNDVTANQVGPQSPTAAATINTPGSGTVGAWANPINVLSQNGVLAVSVIPTQVFNNPSGRSKFSSSTANLVASNYGFALPSNAIVTGIQVDVFVNSIANTTVGTFNLPPDSDVIMVAQLQKTAAGFINATTKGFFGSLNTTGYVTFGGPNDLWKTNWNVTDFNAATFGAWFSAFFFWSIQFNGTFGAQQITVSVDHIRVTLFGKNLPLTSTVGSTGLVSLISGRLYAYAFINAKTGHYSDLSTFSTSTGPVT